MNTAIIAAAGSGARFGSDTPKQFHELLGKPVIIHTLERFERSARIDKIVLVLAAPDIKRFETISSSFRVNKLATIIEGGPSRAESVWSGLRSVEDADGVVAVHDGARPLVSVDEIDRTIAAAESTGAACLVAPVSDTIKKIENGRIVGTVTRSTLRRALTPQAFHYEIIRRAFANAVLNECVSDECVLVEALGIEIACIDGSPANIKITNPEDLLFAEAYLNRAAAG